MKTKNKMKLKLVPLEKQSKKAQREYYQKKRGSWNGVVPVTKAVKSKKLYDRNKMKQKAWSELL